MELIVAEKQKSAKKIAAALNKDFKETSIAGFKLYTINKQQLVTHVSGHICTWEYPSKYRVWRTIKIAELVGQQPLEVTNTRYKTYFKTLIDRYKVDKLGIFTDKDQEGELIGDCIAKVFETYGIVKVIRYSTSELTIAAISKAINNPTDLNKQLAEAARTKHYIDLQWGSVLTVIFTLYGKELYSIGRVQTPVLALLVKRSQEIANFVPEQYGILTLTTDEGQFKSERLAVDNKPTDSITTTSPLETIKHGLQRWPPKPLNSTDLLKLGTRLGVDGTTIMSLAQSLYLKGLITYPRTDSRHTDYEYILGVYRVLKPPHFIQSLLQPYTIKTGASDPAHPPILPTTVQQQELNPLQHKLYSTIVEHYLNILKGPYVYDQYTYSVEWGGIVCTQIRELPTRLGWGQPTRFKRIQTVNIREHSLHTEFTRGPNNYTEGSLVKKMEDLGLGTKSTRHTFTSLLRIREYLKKFVPSLKANKLIKLLTELVPPIVSPKLTQEIEADLKLVETCKLTGAAVFSKYSQTLLQLFKNISQVSSQILAKFAEHSGIKSYTKPSYKRKGSKVP